MERIGKYLVERRLGEGGMGTVYLARSRGGRAVAVKVVKPELARDAEFRERFRAEVAAARVVGGFHTAPVVDADPDAEAPWLATAYVAGPTLSQLVATKGPRDEESLRALGAALAEALQAIHACGLVHRDLKPGNIIMADDGPRVLDFGIARAVEGSRITVTGAVFGTPGFLAPEQAVGRPVDGAADVFALGAVLIAAAGGSAFGEGTPVALMYRCVHEEADLSSLPTSMRPVVAACMAKRAEDRPTPEALLDHFSGGDEADPDRTDSAPVHYSPTQYWPPAAPAPQAYPPTVTAPARKVNPPTVTAPARQVRRPAVPAPPEPSHAPVHAGQPRGPLPKQGEGGPYASVELAKGRAISLERAGGQVLTAVRMGFGWQAVPRRGLFGSRTREIDLDASAILFADNQPVDVVFFRHLASDDGSVSHTGDSLVAGGGVGAGGDDEAILVDLQRVPLHIDQIVFTVNSFTGQTFQEVQDLFCRVVDETDGQELARYTLDGGGQYTAQIMAKVHRSGAGWQMTVIGHPANGRTFQDLLPAILPRL